MVDTVDDLKQNVEMHDGIATIRSSGTTRGWNGIHYKTGMSAKNVGSKNLSINVAMIPPGGVAGAHIHVDFEVMLYIVEGRVRHEFGDKLEQGIENKAAPGTRRPPPSSSSSPPGSRSTTRRC